MDKLADLAYKKKTVHLWDMFVDACILDLLKSILYSCDCHLACGSRTEAPGSRNRPCYFSFHRPLLYFESIRSTVAIS